MAQFSFSMLPEEEAKAKDWWGGHVCKNRKPSSLFPPSYTFTPTGIGMNVKISCSRCKEFCDVTCYERW